MKHILISLLAISCSIVSYGQVLSVDSLISRMERQAILYPSEKVYLHTDRSSYIAGDTVWMKAYVVDGITNIPAKRSRYVYVALQDPFKDNVSKVCLRADEDGFIHGNIVLPEELPRGEYMLCAYTRYMENGGEESFFRRRIVINSVMNKSIRMETSIRKNHLDVRFVNPVTGDVQEVRNCRATSPSDGINLQKKGDGYSVKFHESKDKVVLIEAGNYKEYVRLDVAPDYDVAFLPEGGNLVAGTFNRLAFKSLNSSGQGENISGTLRDERDSVLLEFTSVHRGMGVFGFIPEAGKKYVAVCENHEGRTRRFELPEVSSSGYSLQVNRVKDNFFVRLLSPDGNVPTESLYLLAHQQGWPVMLHPYKHGNMTYMFSVDRFLPGIASFLLITQEGRILNERMVFVSDSLPLQSKVTPEREMYDRREKVSLSFSVKDVSGKDWNGDCSVSVTDNYDVLPDSCVNILSSLLLSGSLRGHVEDPNWYFRGDDFRYREQALDALMMTQGWRRYNLENTWKRNYLLPTIPYEESRVIKGKVTRRISRKPVGNATVQLMIPQMGDTKKLVTDVEGTFRFEGFEYPDSTMYWVSAYTDKGKDNVVVELDTVVPPSLTEFLPPYRKEDMLPMRNEISSEFLAKSDLRILHEKGMRHIFLDEVLVTAPKVIPKTEYENVIGVISIKAGEIKQSGVLNIPTLLAQKIAGCSIARNSEGIPKIFIRGSVATIVIDGTVFQEVGDEGDKYSNVHDFLLNMNKDDIAQIDVIKGASVVSYAPFSGGNLIAITTKRGGKEYNAKWDPTNLKTIMPLGYQLPVEFYSPRYELVSDKEKETPDLRTTIHWQPRVQVKNGKANIEFYTADGLVNYSVVIEGVGEDGSLLRVEERIH